MNPLILLAIAVAPVLAIILFVYSKDKNEREPFGVLFVSFLWGCFSVVPAIILETLLPGVVPGALGASIISVAIYAFVIVAFSEEAAKFIFLRYYAYKKPSFNEPFDGIIYAVMVGMGFATIENIMYVFGDEGGMQTAVLRALTAVPAHATFAAVMGYYVGLAKFNKAKEKSYFLQGIFYATVLHGFYDFFLFQNITEGLYIGAVVSLIIGLRFSMKAMRMHKQYVTLKHSNENDLIDMVDRKETVITKVEDHYTKNEGDYKSPHKPK
ncbi:MAG: PrsW family intramembrane metalloprotease [Fimbriimonadaceae bacterium]|nr:PrsW family intramembrane metalloprotease [Chitinophagales bacterium]